MQLSGFPWLCLTFGVLLSAASLPELGPGEKKCREKTQVNSAGEVACNNDIECDNGGELCDAATYSGTVGSDSAKMCNCGEFEQADKPYDDGVCHAYVVIGNEGSSPRCMPDSNCTEADKPDCAYTDPDLVWKTCSCKPKAGGSNE